MKETHRVSSPSAEIIASHHTHNPEDMSVPAVARRKYMMHERRRRRETRKLVFRCLCVTLAMIIMCVFYNTRYSLSERTVHGALVKNKTRLRGSSYIAPDAQPFVSNPVKEEIKQSDKQSSLLLAQSPRLSMRYI
jgi:hypothetical protein